MSKRVELDQSVILVGHGFNMWVNENPEEGTLEFSILMKIGQELQHQHISSKLDLNADKAFATYKVRAIGRREPVEFEPQPANGVIILDELYKQSENAVDRSTAKRTRKTKKAGTTSGGTSTDLVRE